MSTELAGTLSATLTSRSPEPSRCLSGSWRDGSREMRVPALDREDRLEDEMATHSSILAWKIS